MDLTPSTTPTTKTPEPTETDTPTRINPSPFTNGVLKRHAPLNHHHHPIVITYKECLKNHAAALGTHAVDGCGEFMPSPTSNPTDPTSLKCAACGCHRNFHRRDPDETPPLLLPPPPPIEYQPHHRHHPPPPPADSPINSPSPPPISSAYAPHMLLALSHGGGVTAPQVAPPPELPTPTANFSPQVFRSGNNNDNNNNSRKRFRTKFSQEQKDKMLELAEKVGWKMQKKDEDTINDYCYKIGVDKGVFKVWMHNNKNTVGRKDQNTPPLISTISSSTPTTTATTPTTNGSMGYSIGYLQEGNKDNFHDTNGNGRPHHNHHQHLPTNGSSTSS